MKAWVLAAAMVVMSGAASAATYAVGIRPSGAGPSPTWGFFKVAVPLGTTTFIVSTTGPNAFVIDGGTVLDATFVLSGQPVTDVVANFTVVGGPKLVVLSSAGQLWLDGTVVDLDDNPLVYFAPVPIPASLSFLGLGVLSLAAVRRRARHTALADDPDSTLPGRA